MTPEQWLQQQDNIIECTRYGRTARHKIDVCLARQKRLEDDKDRPTYVGRKRAEHTANRAPANPDKLYW